MGKQERLKQERRLEKVRLAKEAQARAAARRKTAERGAAEGSRRGCLFCRRRDVDFTSVEHIFPESLGNKEKLLPVGVVCDSCNHEVLAPLDAALCDFAPIAMMRAIYGIESKSGKRPTFKFDNGTLHSDRPGNVRLHLDSTKWQVDGLPAPPGHTSWSFTAQRGDMTPKRLAKVHRALAKIAVECAWLDLGETRLLSSEFDRERNIVLNGGHPGYLITLKQGRPEDRNISLTYLPYRRNSDGQPFLGMVASFWGFYIASDTLHANPQSEVPEEIAFVHSF